LLDTTSPGGRRPNLDPELIGDLAAALGLTFVDDGRGDGMSTFGPEDVFHYYYAILNSPAYRARYADLLVYDFPRLPPITDTALFWALTGFGAALIDLHLLRPKGVVGVGGAGGAMALTAPGVPFPVAGPGEVREVRYEAPGEGQHAGRVWINDEQYFARVDAIAWEWRVGGYQPAQRWLTDRRGRTLTFDDLRHYGRIVAALRETARVVAAIDALLPGWPLP